MEESCQWQALVALPPDKARYTNLLWGCWTTESIENPMTNINFLSSIHFSASLVFLSHLLYLCILSFLVSPIFFPFLHVEIFSQISLTTWRYTRKATKYEYQAVPLTYCLVSVFSARSVKANTVLRKVAFIIRSVHVKPNNTSRSSEI